MSQLKMRLAPYQIYIFPLLDFFLNFLNYFFILYTSWYLLVSEYSTQQAYISWLTLLFVVGISWQLLGLRLDVSQTLERRQDLGALLILSGVSLVLLLLTLPWWTAFIRGTYLSSLIVICIYLFHMGTCFFRGFLQAGHRFLALSISFYTEVGIKLIAIVLIFTNWPYVETILVSLLLGMVASFFYTWYAAEQELHFWPPEWKNLGPSFRSFFLSYRSYIFIFFFTTSDLLMMNYFKPDLMPIYVVSVRYAQLIFFVGDSCLAVVLPHLRASYQKSVRDFQRFVIFVFVGLFLLGLFAWPFYHYLLPWTLRWTFPEAYAGAGDLFAAASWTYVSFLILIFSIELFVLFPELSLKGNHLWLLFFGIFVYVSVFIWGQWDLEDIFKMQAVFYGLLSFLLMIILRRALYRVNRKTGETDDSVAVVAGH